MKTMVTMALALVLAIPAAAQKDLAQSGGEVAQWEIEAIEKQIRLVLRLEMKAQDLLLFGTDIYQARIVNSFPEPSCREQEEFIRTFLTDYVTIHSREYSIIRVKKAGKTTIQEIKLVPTIEIADRKIVKVEKIFEKRAIFSQKIEFLYDFIPHVPGLTRQDRLRGRIEYSSDKREINLSVITVSFEDQGILTYKSVNQ